MKRGLMLLSVLSLVLAGTAGASVQQGDTELELLGSFLTENSDEGGADFDAWFAMGSFNYFVTDNLQIGVSGLILETETDFTASSPVGSYSVDVDLYAIGVRGKWHFMPTNQWVPYVGLQALWADASIDDSVGLLDTALEGLLWGPLVGLRFELNANNDFFAEYQYHLWEDDLRQGFDDGHALVFGITHQFK